MLVELEKVIGDLLRDNRMTLSVAESCTGGLVSDYITNVSGSSGYFEGGIVSYSIGAKAEHLGIPPKYIERYGAVSPKVARRMAEGVRKAFHTTIGLSTTGVAGPTGGTKKTPVGTVFIGLADRGETFAKKLNLKGTRREIKKEAARRSLAFLYERLARSRRSSESGMGSGEYTKWINHLSHAHRSEIVLIRKAPKGITHGSGRLGIFPASFNPPTRAHLALIQEAKKAARLDEVLVLLDIQAMDKTPVEAKFEDRLEMVRLAFQRDPTISIGLSNRGLFLEKLKPLRKQYASPVEFFFIVGFDTILRVMDKKYYKSHRPALDRLFRMCRFLIASRGDQEREAFERLFREKGNEKYLDRVSYLSLPERFAIVSASLLRDRTQKGESIRELVPAPIHRFIRQKKLYLS